MKIRNIAIVVCFLTALLGSPLSASAADPQPEASVPPNIIFEPVVGGLTNPIFATHAGDGSGRIFIVQRGGQILIWNGSSLNGTPFLDVSSIIDDAGGEQGLLGLAFDPDYETNDYFYIAYTDLSGDDVLARYTVSSGDADLADSGSAQILLTITDTEDNHNGGMLAFGPDSYLYMSTGDGGGGGDNHGIIGNGQDKTVLLGKILRLDVNPAPPYTIPPSNPYVGSPTDQEEIWAYGLRNPWRFSFDSVTGDLYIGDVGQNTYEEIDFQAAGFAGGANYGWRIREGNACYNPGSGCGTPPAYVAPVSVYDHNTGGCSVTGGYVYRGSAYPNLVGVYLFGDFCSGNLWGLVHNGATWSRKLIASTGYNISSFAEDEAGELYIVNLGGSLIHIGEAPIITATFSSGPGQDGHVIESSENSSMGGSASVNGMVLAVGDNNVNRQVRAILSFATGTLPNNAIVTAAKLTVKKASLTGSDPFASLGQLLADVGNPAFGSVILQPSDFQATAGYTKAGVFTTPVANLYSASLSGASLSKISLTANTQFRLRFTADDNNNMANNLVNFFSGNSATDKPQLIVNYFLP